MIRFGRIMLVAAVAFVKALHSEVRREIHGTPSTSEGRWGDLLDPPLPCGECDLESDECPCLAELYARRFGVKGYSIDQLYRDLEELEHGQS